jgi:hypothetical protein
MGRLCNFALDVVADPMRSPSVFGLNEFFAGWQRLNGVVWRNKSAHSDDEERNKSTPERCDEGQEEQMGCDEG